MEPRIQYAKTADGVSIAFCAVGRGPPFVWVADPPFSHIQLEWQQPVFRSMYGLLSQKRTLIRFDARGLGMSDRGVDDLSLDAQVRDMEAVVDHLGLERFGAGGTHFGGPVVIAYAAGHPERVSHLMLLDSFARTAEVTNTGSGRALGRLLVADWEMFTENVGALAFGWGKRVAHQYGEFIRAAVTPETAVRLYRARAAADVTELLARITAKTLVINHDDLSYLSVDNGKFLAARIPNARLVILEGRPSGSPERLFAAVTEFLDEEMGEAEGPGAEAGAFRTVLFTDVEGSTALTQRVGDAKAREVLREHERIVREALKTHGGSEVKTMGDGFMASFGSATRALECAIAMQRAFAGRDASLPARPEALEGRAEEIRVRIGLNAGEPVAEEGDLFGTAVIVAARIAALAQGGEVLASNVVRELVAGKGFLFADRGEAVLRGFEDPVRLHEVRWRE